MLLYSSWSPKISAAKKSVHKRNANLIDLNIFIIN